MTRMNSKVDEYLEKANKWQAEMQKARAIILGCGLTEELKWGKPCYTFQESNLVILQGFKEYFALMFCKGALLKDRHRLLVKPGENTQAGRQIRVKSVREIVEIEAVLITYIQEAVEAEKAGREVNYKTTEEFAIPEEFQNKLNQNRALKIAFEALTPGRQRGYLLYFSAAKQSKTRESRVKKWMQQILIGKGLDD